MKWPQPSRPTSSRSTAVIWTKDTARNTATDSFTLLRQARERLGAGLRAVEADIVAKTDVISLRGDG